MIETETSVLGMTAKVIAAGEASALRQYREAKEGLAALIERIAEMPTAAATVYGGRQGTLTVRDFYRELAPTIRSDTFRVAIIGEYSTGKSSLLNVLLGLCDAKGRKTEGFLPTAMAPTTAVITSLYYRPDLHVEAVRKNGTRFAADPIDMGAYLTEQSLWRSRHPDAPHAEREGQLAADVREVRVGCDAPLLALGVEVLDTPGLGAVYAEHSEITRRCVATVDAALFLTATDRPMGERETTFLQYVANFTDRLIFVQTKRDLGLQKEHGELVWQRREQESRKCIEPVLQRSDYPFYHVSAVQAALALRQDDAEKWEASGIPALQCHLEQFLVTLRGAPRLQGWTSRARRALGALRLHLENEEDALTARLKEIDEVMPTDDDYDQWAGAREALGSLLAQLIEATVAGITWRPSKAEAFPLRAADQSPQGITAGLQQAVRAEIEPQLRRVWPEELRLSPSCVHRLERDTIRTIQRGLREKLRPLLASAHEEAAKAIKQALGENMPAVLRRYQIGGSPDACLEALSIDLASQPLVRETTTIREKEYHGFLDRCCGALTLLFGGNNTVEVKEYHFNPDSFWAAVDRALDESVRTALEAVAAEVGRFQEAALEELDRIEASARQAQEAEARIRQQSVVSCEMELAQVRDQFVQLSDYAAQMEIWTK